MAWLTDVLEYMVSGRTKANELERLLPWPWRGVGGARRPAAHSGTAGPLARDVVCNTVRTSKIAG